MLSDKSKCECSMIYSQFVIDLEICVFLFLFWCVCFLLLVGWLVVFPGKIKKQLCRNLFFQGGRSVGGDIRPYFNYKHLHLRYCFYFMIITSGVNFRHRHGNGKKSKKHRLLKNELLVTMILED